MAQIRFQDVIAGDSNSKGFGKLQALNSKSEVLGPGRLQSIRELVMEIEWDLGTTAGEITIEAARQTSYSGTWAPLVVIPWTAENKVDQFNFTGSQMNVRARVSSAILGAGAAAVAGIGVTVTAQGNK